LKLKFKKFYFPLFWKFTLAIIFIVVLFGSINAYLIWEDVQKSLEKESQKRALFIGKNIAEQVVTPLLFEDYISVQKILDETRAIDNTVEYIFIVGEDKNIIAHTFETEFPAQLLNANISDSDEKEIIVLLKLTDFNNIIVRDINIPIMKGKLGFVRIGISEEGISAGVMETISRFWIMVVFFLIVGILGALLFAIFITKPINTIRSVADTINLNTLKERSLPKIIIRDKFLGKIRYLFRAEDEIDLLTGKFNQMIERLEQTYLNLEIAQKKLLQSEKLATIGTLSSGLAHEINNPIAGIKNCIRRIQQSPENVEQINKYLRMINEAVTRVEKVIKNLLSFSRKEEIQFTPVSVEEVIERALLLVAPNLENSKISFTKEIKSDTKFIKGSLNHILQILMNLIINAIDAIEENPDKKRRSIKIFAENSDDKYVKLIVEDSGIGIPEDILPKIFDPFYTTKLADKGTGLGLAIISNLMESHNGRIEVESKVNVGTKFILYFPAINGS